MNFEYFNVDNWMRLNKLSMNNCKLSYMLTSKPLRSAHNQNIPLSFQIRWNDMSLSKKTCVKYLDVLINNKWEWSSHTKDLYKLWKKDYFFQRGCTLDRNRTESESLNCLMTSVNGIEIVSSLIMNRFALILSCLILCIVLCLCMVAYDLTTFWGASTE